MLKKLLPILLALIGLGSGVGAGLALKPPKADHASGTEAGGDAGAKDEAPPNGDGAAATGQAAPADEHSATQQPPETPEGETALHDYVKLNNQFVVPVVQNGQVSSMVILALSLEVAAGGTEQVYLLEPKLRDVFLQVLFDHANSGGFAGEFTDSTNMVTLRDALREAAKKTLGALVSDILIIDIARQDL